MQLNPGERSVRIEDASYPKRHAGLGTLTLSNRRLVFEVHVKSGFRKTSDRQVIEVHLDNIQSAQATPGDATSPGRGMLQVQTPKGIDQFEVRNPEEWVEDISNVKLALPPVPGSMPSRVPPITVNVNVTAGTSGGAPPTRVRCPYCKSVYDESKGRCPSCGARFY